MTRVTLRLSSEASGPHAAATPTRLGRYELLTRIASGGMGDIWAADARGDLGARKVVAVKTIRADLALDPDMRAMFVDESRLAAKVRHPNVTEVLDFGMDGNCLYQVMTLIDGVAASRWLEHLNGRQLPLGACLRIAIDALRGLDAVHALRLVHRDVSPQNIVVGLDGVARLTDFGIAKPAGAAESAVMADLGFSRAADSTGPGRVRGKFGYLAPELIDGELATAKSDVFAAGVVLWELLTGLKLFMKAEEEEQPSRLIIQDPRDLAPYLPDAIAEIALRALSADPRARFRNAGKMAAALEAAGNELELDLAPRSVGRLLDRDFGGEIDRRYDAIAEAREAARALGAA